MKTIISRIIKGKLTSIQEFKGIVDFNRSTEILYEGKWY